jgi:hypothetical protein
VIDMGDDREVSDAGYVFHAAPVAAGSNAVSSASPRPFKSARGRASFKGVSNA